MDEIRHKALNEAALDDTASNKNTKDHQTKDNEWTTSGKIASDQVIWVSHADKMASDKMHQTKIATHETASDKTAEIWHQNKGWNDKRQNMPLDTPASNKKSIRWNTTGQNHIRQKDEMHWTKMIKWF